MERTHRDCKHFAKRPDFNSRSWCDGVCLVYVEAVEGDGDTNVPGSDRPCPFYCGWNTVEGTMSTIMMMEIDDFPLDNGIILLESDDGLTGVQFKDGASMRFATGYAEASFSIRRELNKVALLSGADIIYERSR